MSEAKNPTTAVEVPKEFRMTSPGDCILRSSDGVTYKVFQNILSLASPVFRAMFDLAQTPGETPRGSDAVDLPVVSVSEPSSVLSMMLLLIYPCGFFSFPNLDLVVDIFKSYDKYDIGTLSLRLYLHEILISDGTLSENPLGAYTAAWKLGMKEEAQKASRHLHILDLDGNAVKGNFLSWAESGGWDALSALWNLRVRRAEALDGFISVAQEYSGCPTHRICVSRADLRVRAHAALNTPYPSTFNLRLFLNLQRPTPGWNCSNCITQISHPRTDAEVNQDMSLVGSFPQTILWRDT
ncbi:hypothetical protein FRB94_012367 [Tulasnella sp. JGI-2019a]|nr:hypothetical protein FRB93_005798 [Tulasnella sp. JGI-2019a]KAG8991619.1 hypothetical protein FRB94_012367 [Tulasnella sp. JGI-2019a]